MMQAPMMAQPFDPTSQGQPQLAQAIPMQGAPMMGAPMAQAVPMAGYAQAPQQFMQAGSPPMQAYNPYDAAVGQKRGREAGGYAQNKMLASGGLQMRVALQNMEAGTLIGTGGANIKAIRDTSSCHVNVADMAPSSPERLVTFSGTTEQVNAALAGCVEKLEEAAPTAEGEKRIFKVIVPNEQIGSIIGKAGSRAKEIREQTGAFMNISAATEAHQYSPDRIVTVTGDPQQALQAMTRITVQLADHPLEDRPYRGSYDIQQATQRQSMTGSMNMSAPAATAAPGGPECTATFLVLNSHAGHLIGKGGAVINELRSQSGCKIDMSRGEPGMSERPITLTGSIQQCQLAQHLISVKLAGVLTQLAQFEARDRGM